MNHQIDYTHSQWTGGTEIGSCPGTDVDPDQ